MAAYGVLGATPLSRAVAISATMVATALGSDLRAQVEVRDSAGVEIVETPGEVARAPSTLTVSAEPEMQIGLLDGAEPYVFSNISGLALLPGNRVAVVNSGSAELRFFSVEGEHLGSRGGRGQGPGEFRIPLYLGTTPGDSLLIAEGTTGRSLTLYSSDGDGLRTIPWDLRLGTPRGMSESRALTSRRVREGSWDGEGPLHSTEYILLVEMVEETVDTLVSTPGFRVRVVPPNGLSYNWDVPYAFERELAFGDEALFITTPEGPSLLEYSWEGDLRRIARLGEAPAAVSDGEFEAAVAREVASFDDAALRLAFHRVFDELGPPELKPSFQSLIVDAEGWLWAQTYLEGSTSNGYGAVFPDEPSVWLLFDPEGRGRGTVELPAGFSAESISRDYVAGVWRDEYDVEYVRLHRIEGRP